MCHHTPGTEREAWRHEQSDDEADEDDASDSADLSFLNEESDVDVSLLDADD
jgi:hypothetical protein